MNDTDTSLNVKKATVPAWQRIVKLILSLNRKSHSAYALEFHMRKTNESILLVLDDEPSIARLIIRSLRAEFSQILYAETPHEAEVLLKNNSVTHLVCDSNLGVNHPTGAELISDWYNKFLTIQKAVLFTGMDVDSVPKAPGVKVLSKNGSPKDLLRNLRDSLQAPNILS